MTTDRTNYLGLFKTPTGNEVILDRALEESIAHHHSGDPVSVADPTEPPAVEAIPGAGQLPANAQLHYGYTLVDERGDESGLSPVVIAQTDGLADVPAAPTVEALADGGTLDGGNYFYALTAFIGDPTRETMAGDASHAFVPFHRRGSVRLGLPALPTGADGFNVYRRSPGSPYFHHLGTATGASWIDDGSLVETPIRSTPAQNASNVLNVVRVRLPAIPPTVGGWRLFRSSKAFDFQHSLVAQGGPGETTFADIGVPAAFEGPPACSQVRACPEKVDLTDGAEVRGLLPMGLTTYPLSVDLEVGASRSSFCICEAPTARLVGARLVGPADFAGDASATIQVGGQTITVETNGRIGTRQPIEGVTVSEGEVIDASSDSAEALLVSLYLIGYGFEVQSFKADR